MFIVPQFVAIAAELLAVGFRLAQLLAERLTVLLKLLHIVLELAGISRNHIGSHAIPIGPQRAAITADLLAVGLQFLRVFRKVAEILLYVLGVLLRGGTLIAAVRALTAG